MGWGLNHKRPFHSGPKPSTGTRHPRGFSAARGRLWLRRRGRRQRRRRYPGAGAEEARTIAVTISFLVLLPQRRPPQIRRSPGRCVGLQGRWGCPASQSEPKTRKVAGLVRPRAEGTQRRHGPDQPAGASQPGATVTKRRCLAEQLPPTRLQRPHGCPSHAARARGSRRGRRPTRAPDTHDCW